MTENENAEKTAVEFIRRTKNVNEITVLAAEEKNGKWVVRGTCPIDLDGHPWRESFEVEIDQRGKVTSSRFQLM